MMISSIMRLLVMEDILGIQGEAFTVHLSSSDPEKKHNIKLLI